MEGKKKVYLSALDEYINKVYVLVLLLVPGACQCAGILYTFLKIMGWLPPVSWTALLIFDVTCLIYLVIGIYFVKTGFEDGAVKASSLKAGLYSTDHGYSVELYPVHGSRKGFLGLCLFLCGAFHVLSGL